ncbi:hypothetical protein PORY_000427 [Pneumocystis oryctolagi]|uniref:Uncharacterized protein n=1 Tax=Pneumocystis oryctolagi TaxID=42067 RepID=A0ACB7CJI0_9ASCO|nr:hypothetical protein PORY_000427 [Pneumocystis oryctolagi]
MTKKKFIDKKKAVTFYLAHRSQRDPLIYDNEVPSRVLIPAHSGNEQKKSKAEKKPVKEVRENTGEALLYGISYDDTEYDYMQHLREVGKSPGTILLQAPTYKKSDIIHELPKEVFPSETEQKRNYQDQQSVPDSISGFQPDMDPELREVLEALDNDCYLSSDEDGDLDALIKSGKIEDLNHSQNTDSECWDSDDTIKAPKESFLNKNYEYENNDNSAFKEVLKYKKKNSRKSLSTTTYNSMSSSILPRSEALMLLDDRFEKIEKEYNDNNINKNSGEENDSQRIDFELIMDDFLNNYEIIGKKMVLKIPSNEFDTKHIKATAELDEIRQQLGKTKI